MGEAQAQNIRLFERFLFWTKRVIFITTSYLLKRPFLIGTIYLKTKKPKVLFLRNVIVRRPLDEGIKAHIY